MPTDTHEPGDIALREGEEPRPPGVRAMAIVRWILLLVAFGAAVATVTSYLGAGHEATMRAVEPKYYCPMHPQITSDKPGECPICQMTLEPIPEGRKQAGSPARFSSGMTARDAVPGRSAASSDARVQPAEQATGAAMPMDRSANRSANGSANRIAPAPTGPPNRIPVILTLDRVQAIGVRTALVESRQMKAASRVTAVVATPEQGAASIHARTSGYVERIGVDQTGVKVKKGQELVSIYSPEVFQAETELLASRQWNDDGAQASAGRQKLELLGVPPETIEHVWATGSPVRAFGIVAPTSGYVVKKNVVLGSYVTPDMELYELADLSRVYIVADVPQGELSGIRVGITGRFQRRDRAGESIEAKVDLVYPTMDLAARTTRVRMVVANPKLELRPGEFGTVDFALPGRPALVIPQDAVVDTGSYVYVYVDEGNGRYSPRGVVLGSQLDMEVEVQEGLKEGERVVSGATFLLDSESALEASAGKRDPEAVDLTP